MLITFTVKLTPESRQELIDKFGAEFRQFRAGFEQAVAVGAFGDPARVRVRWLLDSARWQDAAVTVTPDPTQTGQPR